MTTPPCENLVRDDVECGKPATLQVDYLAPKRPASYGKVHTHYYCSMPCQEADAVALWGIGHDPVSEVSKI